MAGIILASQSPRRQQLLEQIGLEFEIVASKLEEVIDADISAHEVAMSLAKQKCLDVASNVKGDYIIIAADTIVVNSGKILGKPKDKVEAFEMLNSLNGIWHEVITGLCLYRTIDGIQKNEFVKTRVKMSHSTEDFLHWYVSTGEPLDKAGSYGIQGFGAMLVEEIQGCFYNVMGLPINRLCSMLGELGYNRAQGIIHTNKG